MAVRPGEGGARLIRTAVFSAVALGLAVLAHGLAAPGHWPGLTALSLAVVPVAGCALILSARRCRFTVLVSALGILQAMLHWLFAAIPDPELPPAAVSHPGHHLQAVHELATSGLGGVDAATHVHAATSAPMLVLHAVATLATAWAMAHGERVLWGLAQRLGCRWPRHAHVPAAPRHADAVRPLPTWRVRLGAGALRVRGPPVPAPTA